MVSVNSCLETMNFHDKIETEEANINLTPLIDVVFLLLIFFMVSTTFDTTSQLKIKLPEASQNSNQEPPQKLVLLIDAEGKLFLNARELSNSKAATLQAALERTLDGTKRPIVIQADAAAPVQSMVTAMDVVGRLGLPQVSIATTHPIE